MAKEEPEKQPTKKETHNAQDNESKTRKEELETKKIEIEVKRDTQENNRLSLEIDERNWNLSRLGKLVKLAPLLTVLALGWWYKNQWNLHIEQQNFETERQRQLTITNLKREFTSENSAIRKGAILALAEYPKEALPLLIDSLGDEDTTFTKAVKQSIKQIGKEAIVPLAEELRRLQAELTTILSPLIEKRNPKLKGIPLTLSGITGSVPERFSLSESLNMPLKEIEKQLVAAFPEATYEEIDIVVRDLRDIRTKPQLKVAHKNTVDILAELLRLHYIYDSPLSKLDLRGAFLYGADLSCANLSSSNLSHAKLLEVNLSRATLDNINLSEADLTSANLSGVHSEFVNLSGANLSYSDISAARLLKPNLSGANLSYSDLTVAFLLDANLSEADLTGVKGFTDIIFSGRTNLIGVKGLSEEQLEYAKKEGAIIE